jgi:hypothetical protein
MRNNIIILIILSLLLVGCSQPESRGFRHYDLVKTDALIPPPASMSDKNFTVGAYYPTLLRMGELEQFPYEYAIYFSTDHASDEGGIWLYLCNGKPSQAAGWISYDEALTAGTFDYLDKKPAGNPIYVDTVCGRQTETPHANIVDGRVYMSYHNYLGQGAGQATMMAISDDGINFQRIASDDKAIILNPGAFLDHTGYFRWGPNPFSGVGYQFIGYSLRRGSIDYRSSVWGSDDAIQWDELQMINGWKTDRSIPEDDRFLIWHEFDPTSIRRISEDEYVAICCAGTRAAGKMERLTELYEVFLAQDGCTQTRMARRILGVGGTGSLDSEECSSSAVTWIDDTLHMVYVGTTGGGTINTVMGAVGVFHPDAALTPELADSLRQYHFYSQEEYLEDLMKERKKPNHQ